jgi:hypothetical protein
MTTTPRRTDQAWKYLWDFPSDLSARAASYASRRRISLYDLHVLAVSEFYTSRPESWGPALSTLAKLAGSAYLSPLEYFVTSRQVSHAKPSAKAKTKLPRNRWNLPADIHVRLAAYGNRSGIRYSKLWHTALRHWLNNPLMPSSWREALRILVAEALTKYLESREPPFTTGAAQTAAASVRG